MKKKIFLLAICLFTLSLTVITADNCKDENENVVNSVSESSQFVLKGFVYLGTNFPALGKVVYVKPEGSDVTYQGIVNQNGTFSINFPACDVFYWGIQGYTEDDFDYKMAKSYGVFTIFVNLKK